ncbi:hypothetical protein ZWY2020_034882 [Hordeum vulgare]|nr:hypothetical protein ZWY2020_034882 [Hordeum vulgare]
MIRPPASPAMRSAIRCQQRRASRSHVSHRDHLPAPTTARSHRAASSSSRARDEFKFRHIYRGTPLRHLLTTGWSNFVNEKKLLAGDSIVFLHCQMSNHHLPALSNYRVQSVVKEKERTCFRSALRPETKTPPIVVQFI